MEFTQCKTCIKADVCNRKSQIEKTYKSIINCSLPHMGSIAVKVIMDDMIKITFECLAYKENKDYIFIGKDGISIPCTPITMNCNEPHVENRIRCVLENKENINND